MASDIMRKLRAQVQTERKAALQAAELRGYERGLKTALGMNRGKKSK